MSIFAAISGQLYGPAWGGKIVSIFISLVGAAGISIGLVQQFMIAAFGYFTLFLILAGCSLAGLLIVLIFFTEDN